jgi:RNA polymerase sigma factor (TIGR02999 family)
MIATIWHETGAAFEPLPEAFAASDRIARIHVTDGRIKSLLRSWREGDEVALEELTALVYPELRRLAGAFMRRERSGHTLQTTALVHEVYLRFARAKAVDVEDRSHFLGVAARLMRQVLIEHARRKQCSKRGGEALRVPLEEGLAVTPEGAGEVLALDEALRALEQIDARKAEVVEMRYFGGMTVPEIAEALQVSGRTVERDLRLAHAWLYRRMQSQTV